MDSYGTSCNGGEHGRDKVSFRQGCSALFWINLVTILFIALAIFVFGYLPYIFSFLDDHIQNKYLLGAIGSFVTLLIGFSLYRLRERKLRIYALVEIAVALVTGWISITRIKVQGDLAIWVALAASAYITVRGLDNYQKAKEKLKSSEPNDYA
jgi:hypothetical protein